jgi:cell division protein FtsI/penicillin-binding protein 2
MSAMEEQKVDKKYIKAYLYKCTQRDERNHCRVGSVVECKGKLWLVAITTHLFVYLVLPNGKHNKLSWQQWKKLDKKIERVHFRITKKIIKTIKVLKETMSIEYEMRKELNIVRKPSIKRTPVKKKKKRKK